MKYLLLAAVLLVGCAHKQLPAVTCPNNVTADYEVNCVKVQYDINLAVNIAAKHGWKLDPDIPIHIRDMYYWFGLEETGLVNVTGQYNGHGIELSRTGKSLLHEMLHAYDHDLGDHKNWGAKGYYSAINEYVDQFENLD